MRFGNPTWAAALSVAVLGVAFAGRADEETTPAAGATANQLDEKTAEPIAQKATGRKAIETALAKKVDAELIGFTLPQFAQWVEATGGIEVEVDSRCIVDGGMDPDAIEITLEMHDVSLAAVLYHALSPRDLTYVISGGVLVITSMDFAETLLEIRIYPAADLVTFRGPDGKVRQDVEPLVELITGTVATSTWDRVGGAGTIRDYDGMLVASQTREMHQRIDALIATLRTSIDAQRNGNMESRTIGRSMSDDRAAHAALESAAKVNLEQTPLRRFADHLARDKRVPVLVDARSIIDAGLDPDALELSGEFDAASLRSVLERVLSRHDLTHLVDHEAIVITTFERASRSLETSIYPVGDLLTGGVDVSASLLGRAKELQDVLTTTVDIASWDTYGGNNSMAFAAPWKLLVVSAPSATQRKVAATLDELRDARRRQKEMDLTPTEVSADLDPMELRVFALPTGPSSGADRYATNVVADLVRDLVPETREAAAGDAVAADAPYLRVVAGRLVVRHRRSVVDKIAALIKQFETDGDSGPASKVGTAPP